ncbi:MAG TPA: amidohydrolase family protein [Acidobacteriaceae bacterium]|nr:amidohydrolase family protein [Acidobacteriaceae bacterium]
MPSRYAAHTMKLLPLAAALTLTATIAISAQHPAAPSPPVILHAAHLLDVANARLISPGEVLVQGERIVEAGPHVTHPAGAQVIDLGDNTLMPGLIDAHVHLFLHPGNEAFQTVEESVPQRTLLAAAAAKADLLAGFTAERDMGTEGAGCADVAVRDAINHGLIPGPRMRVSCNAIDINGGHEDTSGLNPQEHLLSNADRANTADEVIAVMREQHKQGADFTKIYESGRDKLSFPEDADRNDLTQAIFTTPYQYTREQLTEAVHEADRTGSRIGVHCTGEPGAGFAAAAGVASIDHAYSLSPDTMRSMYLKHIYAVPTFAISEYFGQHADTADRSQTINGELAFHAAQFKLQLAAKVPFAVGSDVGPFPHGTQAREYELMVKYGMSPADTLKAGLLNGAILLDWADQIGQLLPNFYADIIAVPGNPLENISVLTHPTFVMKNGQVIRKD